MTAPGTTARADARSGGRPSVRSDRRSVVAAPGARTGPRMGTRTRPGRPSEQGAARRRARVDPGAAQGAAAHGYEIIQEIAERSGGAWKPSPGSVYPTLQLLEDEGLITSASEGGKKLFTLTEAGRTEADAGAEAPWEEAGRGVDWESLHEIRKAGGGLVDAFRQVWATGTPGQREKALVVVNEARKKLYLILADEADDAGE